jgi:hypothetical protein
MDSFFDILKIISKEKSDASLIKPKILFSSPT